MRQGQLRIVSVVNTWMFGKDLKIAPKRKSKSKHYDANRGALKIGNFLIFLLLTNTFDFCGSNFHAMLDIYKKINCTVVDITMHTYFVAVS